MIYLSAVAPALGNRAPESINHPRLVTLGLKSPDKPRSRVAQGFVVYIGRVLGCQDTSQANRPALLEKRHQRSFRWGLGNRGKETIHFVKIEYRP